MVRSHGISEIGAVRKINEDYFAADETLQLFVVADGLGGHAAGEVASRLAVEAISGFMRRSHNEAEISWPYGIDPKSSFDANRLRTAVCLANRRVFRAAENDDNYTGMGTTIVGALFSGSRLIVAHVGDSRVYLMSEGTLTRLTQDDSWGATVLAEQYRDDPEQLVRHPMRNVLTNVLGAREEATVHLRELELQGRVAVLLCTDGLHGVVDDDSLGRVMGNGSDLAGSARQLVDLALTRGSRDNITALLVEYDPKEDGA